MYGILFTYIYHKNQPNEVNIPHMDGMGWINMIKLYEREIGELDGGHALDAFFGFLVSGFKFWSRQCQTYRVHGCSQDKFFWKKHGSKQSNLTTHRIFPEIFTNHTWLMFTYSSCWTCNISWSKCPGKANLNKKYISKQNMNSYLEHILLPNFEPEKSPNFWTPSSYIVYVFFAVSPMAKIGKEGLWLMVHRFFHEQKQLKCFQTRNMLPTSRDSTYIYSFLSPIGPCLGAGFRTIACLPHSLL